MYIDPQDLLFHDLDEDLALELRQWAENVVLRGKIAYPEPPWVQMWLDSAGLDRRQGLLTISTVLPARIFLSVLRYRDGIGGPG